MKHRKIRGKNVHLTPPPFIWKSRSIRYQPYWKQRVEPRRFCLIFHLKHLLIYVASFSLCTTLSLGDPGLNKVFPAVKGHSFQVPYCSKSLSIKHTSKEQYMIRPISASPPPIPQTFSFFTYTANAKYND